MADLGLPTKGKPGSTLKACPEHGRMGGLGGIRTLDLIIANDAL